MITRSIVVLLFSIVGGVAGSFIASLISFVLYPLLRSDFSMFLSDLLSTGGMIAAVFAWLFYVPSLIALVITSWLITSISPIDRSYGFFAAVSFLSILVSQLHLFTGLSEGIYEYLLNTLITGLILMGTLRVMRYRRT